MEPKRLKDSNNPLADVEEAGLKKSYQRKGSELLYEAIMKSGGEPFGTPFEVGIASLTERVVKFFRQKSFFGFETLERLRDRNLRNKFTRTAARNFKGELKSPSGGFVKNR